MSFAPISEDQLDRGRSDSCWNLVTAPLRKVVQDLRVAGSPDHLEIPCSNEQCPRHGVPSRRPRWALGDPDTRAYKAHQLRRRLMLLAQRRAATGGAAAPAGVGDNVSPQAGA